ncbi:e3f4c944-add2-4e60-b40d-b33ea9685ffd [Thermothielavioides terrestris]|uniref:E3f4c944-add2-4e60-b40d-b33ea9685ffd n=1 Tax=Thermothielavioides terrestris TaxID=2587410 RepID=A0A3S4F5V4_9PEZI|nr:e3f4c944-add2-4e60-b40d-b33ea9685ffd [Thermothielavioides terrestris]
MVQTYSIFGKQVASHYLAMGVLGTLFGGVYLSTGGSKKTPAAPPINASSPDEADFIKKFIEEADAEEKKANAAKH